MKILGLDPGTHRIGYGVIEVVGSNLQPTTYGCLETKPAVLLGDRLVEISDTLDTLIRDHQPDAIAIEELYFVQNVTTGLKVAEARGVLLLGARRARIPVAEYKPNLIKSTVAGYGLAGKQQVQRMVQLLLKLPSLPKPDDAADGLAIAITHAILSRNPNLEIRNVTKKILKP